MLTARQREEVRTKADLAQKKAHILNNSVRFAIAEILPNTLNGCFWGFTDVETLKAHKKAIEDEDRLIARKIAGDAVLLEVEPKLLIESVQQIDKNAFTVEDANNIKDAQAGAKYEFERFLIIKGKKEETYNGTIGIYCINKVTSITLGKTQHRAFRLNMKQVLDMLSRYNYLINIKGTYMEPSEAVEHEKDLWESVKLSPSKTGLFINIKYNGTREEMLSFEKQFRLKYSLD